jgi:hypothetical protein
MQHTNDKRYPEGHAFAQLLSDLKQERTWSLDFTFCAEVYQPGFGIKIEITHPTMVSYHDRLTVEVADEREETLTIADIERRVFAHLERLEEELSEDLSILEAKIEMLGSERIKMRARKAHATLVQKFPECATYSWKSDSADNWFHAFFDANNPNALYVAQTGNDENIVASAKLDMDPREWSRSINYCQTFYARVAMQFALRNSEFERCHFESRKPVVPYNFETDVIKEVRFWSSAEFPRFIVVKFENHEPVSVDIMQSVPSVETSGSAETA